MPRARKRDKIVSGMPASDEMYVLISLEDLSKLDDSKPLWEILARYEGRLCNMKRNGGITPDYDDYAIIPANFRGNLTEYMYENKYWINYIYPKMKSVEERVERYC